MCHRVKWTGEVNKGTCYKPQFNTVILWSDSADVVDKNHYELL